VIIYLAGLYASSQVVRLVLHRVLFGRQTAAKVTVPANETLASDNKDKKKK